MCYFKDMINKTFLFRFLFCWFLFIGLNSCGTSGPATGETYATVEEAEKARAKSKRKDKKIAKKNAKATKKAYWKKQSKDTKRRVKLTEKNMKRVKKGKKPKKFKAKGKIKRI